MSGSNTCCSLAIQGMSRSEFEHTLAERLRNPVPAALRSGTCADRVDECSLSVSRQIPTQQRYSTQSLSRVGDKCLFRLPDTPYYSAGNTCLALESSSPPLRKESITVQDRHRVHLDHNAENITTTPSRLSANNQLITAHAQGLQAGTDDQRRYVLHELLATEETYIKDLEIIVVVFAVPLSEYAKSQGMQMDAALRPLQALLSFQYTFLRAMLCATDASAASRVFLSEANGFDVYVSYCSKYSWLCSTLDDIETDSAWSGFFKEVQEQIALRSDRRRLGLRDFLIKPVQRICKYPLFIKDLIKHTDADLEPDTHAELECALNLICQICQSIDEEQHYSETMRLRDAVLSRYKDNAQLPVELVAKLGPVSLSGPLGVSSQEPKDLSLPRVSGCVLFKRFFIVFKMHRSAQVFPQFWFPLHTMRLVDTGDAYSWHLQHLKSGHSMSFIARTASEKRLWIEHLDRAIACSLESVKRQSQNPAQMVDFDWNVSTRETPFPGSPLAAVSATIVLRRDDGSYRGQPNKRLLWDHHNATSVSLSHPTSTGLLALESRFEQFAKGFQPLTCPEILRLSRLSTLDRTLRSNQPSETGKSKLLRRSPLRFTRQPVWRPTPSLPPLRIPSATTSPTPVATNPDTCLSTSSSDDKWYLGTHDDTIQELCEIVSPTSTTGSTCHESASESHKTPHSRRYSAWSSDSAQTTSKDSGGLKEQHTHKQAATTASPSLTGRILGIFEALSIRRRKRAARLNAKYCDIDSCSSCNADICNTDSNESNMLRRVQTSSANASKLVLVPLFLSSSRSLHSD